MPAKAVVFDLGKVLFDFDLLKFTKLFSKKTPHHIDNINELLTKYTDLAILYEKGNIDSLNFYEAIKEKTRYSGSYNEFCVIWNNIFTPIEQTIELAAKTASKYPVGILSNTNELHWNYLQERYPSLFMIFDKKFLSHELHLRKPEDEIFQALISDYGLKPEEIFFTDDMEVNVAAASKNGIVARQFKTAAKLEENFKELGIKI
ncbi:MAG: HAD family phosphatase [Endomicrobium sp.]|jgi:putative hydrolase of the HAD superfamily|nr:HAD family phosphatase [Endomicrobium sp.]